MMFFDVLKDLKDLNDLNDFNDLNDLNDPKDLNDLNDLSWFPFVGAYLRSFSGHFFIIVSHLGNIVRHFRQVKNLPLLAFISGNWQCHSAAVVQLAMLQSLVSLINHTAMCPFK